MNLIIQIRDGQPYEHPILLENFVSAFPNVDVNNLPPEFARFERVSRPTEGPYEEITGLSYQWVNGVVKDVWDVRQFTEQEKIDKQNFIKAQFAIFPNYQSWTFNETTCIFDPPIPYPNDGEMYAWDEALQQWIHSSQADYLLPTNQNPNT